jgi:hypothetical protein
LPIRTGCVLFDLENSRYEEIVNTQIEIFTKTYLDFERRQETEPAGSVHDSQIFKNSRIGDILESGHEFCLGDKGYVGCKQIIHPKKRRRHPLTGRKIHLTAEEKEFNKHLSHYRIVIENVNSSLKNWSILSTVYRDLERHHKLFTCCAILINMAAEH